MDLHYEILVLKSSVSKKKKKKVVFLNRKNLLNEQEENHNEVILLINLDGTNTAAAKTHNKTAFLVEFCWIIISCFFGIHMSSYFKNVYIKLSL